MKRAPAWQRERDKLLRDAGFVDIEEPGGGIRDSDPGHRRRDAGQIETTAEYYRAAGKLLHERTWPSPIERRIWELHADGASYTRVWRTVKREIADGSLPTEKMYRRRVHATVTRLRALMMGTTAKHKRPGRQRDPNSLRSHGVMLRVRMTPAHALMLDHLRAQLDATGADVVRKGLELLEKSIR